MRKIELSVDQLVHLAHLQNVLKDLKHFSDECGGGKSLISLAGLRTTTALEFLQRMAPNGLKISFLGSRSEEVAEGPFLLTDLVALLNLHNTLNQAEVRPAPPVYDFNEMGIGIRGEVHKGVLVNWPPNDHLDNWKDFGRAVCKLLNGAS